MNRIQTAHIQELSDVIVACRMRGESQLFEQMFQGSVGNLFAAPGSSYEDRIRAYEICKDRIEEIIEEIKIEVDRRFFS
jgi:hypothetical protein